MHAITAHSRACPTLPSPALAITAPSHACPTPPWRPPCRTTFYTEACGFGTLFPGITVHPLTLTFNFRVPFGREFLLLHGVCDCSREACLRLLTE